jgi:osmotically inducible lipoprotein OsmB
MSLLSRSVAAAAVAALVLGMAGCSGLDTREQRVLSGGAIGAGAGAAVGAATGVSILSGAAIGAAAGAVGGYVYDKHQ